MLIEKQASHLHSLERRRKEQKLNRLSLSVIQSKKMDRIFQKFREKLGREEKIKLNLILNSSALTEIEASHSLSVLDELNRGIVGEFEHWLKHREPQQRKVLLDELEKLKQYQKQRVQKHKEPGLGTKACFWGVGTILAGLGYHAAVGHKSNELDRVIEKEQRKRTREIFLAAQGIFLGTCGVNVIYNVLERVRKKKELGKNPFLKNTEKDWRELENVIKETQTNRTTKVHLDETINDSWLVAKDIIRIMANRKKQYEKLEPRILSDNDHKRLNRDMNKVLNDDFYFRFDQDCIKNFLKRSF